MNGAPGMSDISASFTFGPRGGTSRGFLQPPNPDRGPSSSSTASSSSAARNQLQDEDAILNQLKGGRGGSRTQQLNFDSPTGRGAPRASDSPFAASPRNPRRRMMPHTPNGANSSRSSAPGLNYDGSFSVMRDDDEANNSGLLDHGPPPRQLDLFGHRSGGMRSTPMREGGSAGLRTGPGPSSLHDTGAAQNESIIEHSLSQVMEEDEEEDSSGRPILLAKLRRWRQDAMEHHLFETAIFWGEKILWMEADEGQRSTDAYWLAKGYFLTHQYSRAEHLLMTPLPALPSSAPGEAAGANNDGANGFTAEIVPEEDALQAAITATRSTSILPPSFLNRHSVKSGTSAGAIASLPDDNLAAETETIDDGSAPRKRKDRDFTVSGTGTGSESNGEDDGESDAFSSGGGDEPTSRGIAEELKAKASNRPADFRKGDKNDALGSLKPATGSDANLPLPPRVYTAWKEEQDRAVADVTTRRYRPPDKTTLAGSSTVCRFLAAKCLVRQGKFGEALDLIGEESGRWKGGGRYGFSAPSSDGLLKLASSVCHLRGLIHLRLDDLAQAKEAFIEALQLDVKNYDAFACLVDNHLVSAKGEAWSLLSSLQWEAQSGGDSESFNFIRMCYASRLGKEVHEDAVRASASRRALWDNHPTLRSSPDLLFALAEDLYARRRYKDAFVVTCRILELDAEHQHAIDLHIGSIASSPLLRESERPRLFLLANRLVDRHPERASSWYAVGVWYVISEKWSEARRHFSKATLLNPRHLPSWLSFAHSFSLEGESEQAVLAYSSVVRNFPDVAHAKVCVGSEHFRMGNLQLARLFFDGACNDGGGEGDEERGVLCYLEGRTDEAIGHLERALKASQAISEPQPSWGTVQLNLAWAYLRANRNEEAARLFSSVVSLDAGDAAACLGMGMVRHKQGDLADAIGWYHEALGIDPRHGQATDLLQFALEEYAKEAMPMAKRRGTDKRLGFPPEASPAMGTDDGRGDAASLGLGTGVGSLSLDSRSHSLQGVSGTVGQVSHSGGDGESESGSRMMEETRITAGNGSVEQSIAMDESG